MLGLRRVMPRWEDDPVRRQYRRILLERQYIRWQEGRVRLVQ